MARFQKWHLRGEKYILSPGGQNMQLFCKTFSDSRLSHQEGWFDTWHDPIMTLWFFGRFGGILPPGGQNMHFFAQKFQTLDPLIKKVDLLYDTTRSWDFDFLAVLEAFCSLVAEICNFSDFFVEIRDPLIKTVNLIYDTIQSRHLIFWLFLLVNKDGQPTDKKPFCSKSVLVLTKSKGRFRFSRKNWFSYLS